MRHRGRCIVLLIGILWLLSVDLWATEPRVFFRQEVEPILRKHCFSCHSHAAGQMEGGLALDWKSGWTEGGGRGPAVVPGEPTKSLLIRAVQHTDPELKMPEEKLGEQQIATLIEWVRTGAFDDRVARPQTDDPRSWWSLQPLNLPAIPPVEEARSGTATNPIDAFILARLAEQGLTFSPAAAPHELVRRLSFDLLGLPPSPDEVQTFEADPSPAAYQRLVDRYLASPRYGERWARYWLDTIHFADSHGYEHDVGRDAAWPYRDYVIRALNQDLPWSTFIRQQLAVDYFEPDASELLPALGFLGAGTFDFSTYSTGPITFDYLDRDDMLTQTMAAFVSTTANCARCHAHKFDPITQEDYYALQAVFAGVIKGEIGYDAEASTATRRRYWQRLADAAKQRDKQQLLTEPILQLTQTWLNEHGRGARWMPLQWDSYLATEGSELSLQPDGTLLSGGPAPEIDTYLLTGHVALPRITALRLDLFPHASLPMQGPGRCSNGNLHLSEVQLTLFEPGSSKGKPIAISRATADFNQEGWSIERTLDGNPKTAWGIHPAVGQAHHAVFELTQPCELPAGSRLTVTLRQLHGGSHLLGAFRLSATDAPVNQTIALPGDVEQILQKPADQRSHDEQVTLSAHLIGLVAESELSRLPAQAMVYAVGRTVRIPTGTGKSQPANRPAAKVVHLLHRGDIGQPRQEVTAGALSVLTHLPARFTDAHRQTEAARRAALADWIAHRDNVLTWRSIVNRVWHYHFGRGLCDTPSDLGRMGGVPSHPELIDWLAIWFRDKAQGSLKQLHRLIVTSHVYQQSSQSRSDAALIDESNRLLWRQNRQRLDADAFRDAILFASGRLDLTMGGPAVQHFHQSPGPQLTPKLDYAGYDWSTQGAHRRSIYRYVWRGIPDPLMAALDFPDLGLLAPTRASSTSPLQSLTLYNNAFVLFHCQAMAQQIQARTTEPDQQVREVLQRTVGRDRIGVSSQALREFVAEQGLETFCRVMFNSNEFLFVP